MRAARLSTLVLLAAVLLTPLRAEELTTIAGKKADGKLVGVNAEGVVFNTNGSDVKVSSKELRMIDFGHKISPLPKDVKFDEIELTDASVIRCTQLAIKGKLAIPTPIASAATSVPSFEMPLSTVFTVMRNAGDANLREEWRKMLATRGKRDLYVIRTADGMNFLPGTVLEGSETGDSVTFEREDGTRSPLRLSRATGGLVFNQPPQASLPPTLCKVYDTLGNVLYATAIRLEGSSVIVTTVAGATVTYPNTESLAKLDYAQGNIVYLSDLDPQVEAPEALANEIEVRLPWKRDKNQLNEALRLEGQSFAKGLWVYADTTLTFPIGGDYREFKALVGADDTITNGTTLVKLTIEADGRVLLREEIKRTDKPRNLNLDVKGAKQLKIRVEADVPYNGSQLIFAEARVQK